MWTMKTAKAQEKYLMDPLPDITAYELARIIQAWDYARFYPYEMFVKYVEDLPDSVKRHIKRGDERLVPEQRRS